jgi:hypothetical protein
MDAKEIWETIVKADEKLKYATDRLNDVRRRQATELLQEALAEAQKIGNEQLAGQARTRLHDLGVEPDA